MSKHTPGPWKFQRPLEGKGWNIFDSTHGLIAEIRPQLEINADLEEVQSNATLIAAAPEMLESLRAVYKCLCLHNEYPAICRDIAATISKAEGLDK